MKLTLIGALFELSEIPFRVGHTALLQFTIPDSKLVISEMVRSIKHYNRFFRSAQPKKEDIPKKLIELHFIQLKAENRLALQKYLLTLSVEKMKKITK